ncbi:uncharacterized protein (DUF58 family) [Paucibacter oligotrophus]|uniref:Uncharacterized protein (DUF58 family) n=1 Tax=Roseateles oligotrophus TaxID=1769250 RepID=A0A840L1N1_9BURK|nr:DUF58 domain-containing protein [Roseateles oligotrophus]MBB4841731.1 uncharacterized protein (DUF58 family) [Roseateles oligotrophus]
MLGFSPPRRWQAWLAARHPLSDSTELLQRNIYILPSRAGLAFCLTLVLLLIASINDQLSLGYLLTFLLTGAGLASMQQTHANLRGLSLDLKTPEPAFAGQDLQLELRLHNPGTARYGIGLRVQRGAPGFESASEEIAWTDVPALGHAILHLRLPAGTRGHKHLPTLQIISRFPLGLFRVWSVWRPAAQVWVYPQPETPAPPFTLSYAGEEAQPQNSATPVGPPGQGQDFEGVRPYQRGDSLRQVLWKKAALSMEQGTPLWVRETRAPAQHALWLDWRDAAPLDAEAGLSRLTAWVLAAEKLQAPYGLRLQAQVLPQDLGPQHKRQCLELLASQQGGRA